MGTSSSSKKGHVPVHGREIKDTAFKPQMEPDQSPLTVRNPQKHHKELEMSAFHRAEWGRICELVPRIHQPRCIRQMQLAARAVDVITILVFGYIRDAENTFNLDIPKDIQMQTHWFLLGRNLDIPDWSQIGRKAADILIRLKDQDKFLNVEIIDAINTLWAEPAIKEIFKRRVRTFYPSDEQFWNSLRDF